MSTNRQLPQVIEFSQYGFPVAFCPFCGQRLTEGEDCYFGNCDHVEFIFTEGELINSSPKFEAIWEEHGEYIDIYGQEFQVFLASVGYDENLLIYCMTGNGVACGPVSTTSVYGLKFSPCPDDEEEDFMACDDGYPKETMGEEEDAQEDSTQELEKETERSSSSSDARAEPETTRKQASRAKKTGTGKKESGKKGSNAGKTAARKKKSAKERSAKE